MNTGSLKKIESGNSGMAGDESSVKVFVRTRPPSSKEIAEGAQPCVEVNAESAEVIVRGKKSFTFDGAMPMSISQVSDAFRTGDSLG